MQKIVTLLLRNLIFLASMVICTVLFLLGYVALSPSIEKHQAQKAKYDDAYFKAAVKDFGKDVELDPERIKNGIHVETGLAAAPGFKIVRAACTGCHSANLITQNSATREGWEQMIRWMQETQGLPDLGKNEGQILNYLAKHYAPEEVGRRRNLAGIEWYTLEK